MSLPVVLRPDVELELADAWAWYEAERPGLGEEFLACVDAAIARVARDPLNHGSVHGDLRRILTRRFPFAVIYTLESDSLLVLAVAHLRREPHYWLGR